MAGSADRVHKSWTLGRGIPAACVSLSVSAKVTSAYTVIYNAQQNESVALGNNNYSIVHLTSALREWSIYTIIIIHNTDKGSWGKETDV